MSEIPETLEEIAALYDQMAAELERAHQHAKIAAQHFRDRDVPRGCAHAFAVEGHIRASEDLMSRHLTSHARRALLTHELEPPPAPG